MTPEEDRMSQASSTVDFDHRVHTLIYVHARAHVHGHTNMLYSHFPPPLGPVHHSHVIDAPAKTPSIFRAHGSAICSTHKRMTSLQVIFNIECKSALNSSLLQRKMTRVSYCPWRLKSITLRTEMQSFVQLFVSS